MNNLRYKILISLVLIGVCFFSVGIINFIQKAIAEKITEEISLKEVKKAVTELAENNARNQSRAIAKQMQIYINDHPNLTLKDLQADPVFQNIAVQEYGKKSYSAVLSSDCITVFHISPKIVGMRSSDFQEKLHLPTNEIWEKIHKPACQQGIETEGYYTWRHIEGSPPEKKFIRMSYAGTTADGKKLYVGATVYVAEFYTPVEQLEAELTARKTSFLEETKRLSRNAFKQIMAAMVAGLAIFCLIWWKEKDLETNK